MLINQLKKGDFFHIQKNYLNKYYFAIKSHDKWVKVTFHTMVGEPLMYVGVHKKYKHKFLRVQKKEMLIFTPILIRFLEPYHFPNEMSVKNPFIEKCINSIKK